MNEITVVRNNSGGLVLSVSGEALEQLKERLSFLAMRHSADSVTVEIFNALAEARPLAVGDEVIVTLPGGDEIGGEIEAIDDRGRLKVLLDNGRTAWRCSPEQARRRP